MSVALGIVAGIAFASIAASAAVFVYIGSRIDRLVDRLGDVEQRLSRIEQKLDDHLALPAHVAHGGRS